MNHTFWGFSYGFPMVFLRFSQGFPKVSLWFSYGLGYHPLWKNPFWESLIWSQPIRNGAGNGAEALSLSCAPIICDTATGAFSRHLGWEMGMLSYIMINIHSFVMYRIHYNTSIEYIYIHLLLLLLLILLLLLLLND